MEKKKIIEHIAIILDGNGRWAKEKGKNRTYGHKVGFKHIKPIAFHASSLGIKALSLYCFSTENWNRPKEEVDYLMSIPKTFVNDIDNYKEKNIKVIVSGRKDRIPKDTLDSINKLINETKDMTGMVLNICFDYGALWDIQNAINNMIKSGKDNFEETAIYGYLTTASLPKVDLLIRTGGEKRLSNYLLLEASYAELYFTDIYWPAFTVSDLDKAILDYNKRDRRFGGIKE